MPLSILLSGRRVAGSAGLRQPGLSWSVTAWIRVFQVSFHTHTQRLCHMPCESVALACLRAKARKALCPRRWGENVGPRRSACAWCTSPGSSRKCRSLTTRTLLWRPRRSALKPWGLVAREKPHQHSADLLLFDDTAQCLVQPDDAGNGTDARHCARAQSPH
jgi:hypothetical protein